MSDTVNENVIEFLRNQKTTTATFCQGRFIRKIKKLAEKHPDRCQIAYENEDGSIVAHFPTKWVRIVPTVEREFTEEEKGAFRDRMEKARTARASDEDDIKEEEE